MAKKTNSVAVGRCDGAAVGDNSRTKKLAWLKEELVKVDEELLLVQLQLGLLLRDAHPPHTGFVELGRRFGRGMPLHDPITAADKEELTKRMQTVNAATQETKEALLSLGCAKPRRKSRPAGTGMASTTEMRHAPSALVVGSVSSAH